MKGLKKNFLSMGQWDDPEYEFYTKNRIMKVVKGTLVVMKVEKIVANLYMQHGRIYKEMKTFIRNFEKN